MEPKEAHPRKEATKQTSKGDSREPIMVSHITKLWLHSTTKQQTRRSQEQRREKIYCDKSSNNDYKETGRRSKDAMLESL